MATLSPDTVDSFILDGDDRRIVRALQIQPRASFAAIAAVLGMSEPTVSRRYARLCRLGLVRVTGVVDPGALGQGQWLVRLRCRPGSAVAIADALAARDDISWVSLASGGAEISCAVRSRSRAERDDLLGHRLPRATAVLDLEASVILHKFLGGRARHWAFLDRVLTTEEERAVGSDGTPFDEEPIVADTPVRLDPSDDKLLGALATDGRASHVELANAACLTSGRAARRLQVLLDRRVVHLHVEIAEAALGLPTAANLWLRVRPAELSAVGRALAELPEVGFVAATSGRDNLHAQLHCRDLDQVFAFSSDRVGALTGIESAEVSVIQRRLKQASSLVDGERLRG